MQGVREEPGDLVLPFTEHSLVHSRPVPRLCGRSEPRLLGLQPERRQLIRTVPCTKSSPAPWEKLAGLIQTNCLHPGPSLSFVILRELPTLAAFLFLRLRRRVLTRASEGFCGTGWWEHMEGAKTPVCTGCRVGAQERQSPGCPSLGFGQDIYFL